MRHLYFLFFFALIASSISSVQAGSIKGDAIEDYRWQTTCKKPPVPKIFKTKQGTVNEAKAAYKKFETAAAAFVHCVKDDLTGDMAKIQTEATDWMKNYNEKAQALLETIQRETNDGTFPKE